MAAGALHSAQLLQLSGIGPATLLQTQNISVAVNLSGVGQNLQDHCLVGTFYPCTEPLLASLTLDYVVDRLSQIIMLVRHLLCSHKTSRSTQRLANNTIR